MCVGELNVRGAGGQHARGGRRAARAEARGASAPAPPRPASSARTRSAPASSPYLARRDPRKSLRPTIPLLYVRIDVARVFYSYSSMCASRLVSACYRFISVFLTSFCFLFSTHESSLAFTTHPLDYRSQRHLSPVLDGRGGIN